MGSFSSMLMRTMENNVILSRGKFDAEGDLMKVVNDDQPVPGVAEPGLSERGNTSASLAAGRMPGGW